MTVYYIDPASGSDTNNGLSWAQAWRTFWGLQVASVVPGAGDEIRIAKSPTYTPAMGELSAANASYVTWYRNGEVAFTTDDFSNGRQTMRGLSQFPDGTDGMHRTKASTYLTGTLTPDVPANAYDWYAHYAEVHATAYAGEYNEPNAQLFGGGYGSIQSANASGLHRVTGSVRCRVPYTGPGDGDLPAGALELRLYNGTTLLEVCPLPAIRNSSTEYTPFSHTFAAPWPATYIPNFRVWVARSSVPISRDTTSPFGVELSGLCIVKQGAITPFTTVFELTRSASWSGNTGEVVGGAGLKVLVEAVAEDDLWVDRTVSLPYELMSRVSNTITNYIQGWFVPELPWTGALPYSPPGAAGIFNLNGSTGGTAGSPLVITGGWNTTTGEVDGTTVFSGGLSQRLCSQFSLLDLQWADHVRIENVGAAYGFRSLFTRAKTVHAKACGLPYSPPHSGFGSVTTETNVTLENMYIAPPLLEGFGTIGDLTMVNAYYVSQRNTLFAEARNEVNNLTLTDSRMGIAHAFYGPGRPTYIRGDATLTQCTLWAPSPLISVAFGHKLRFLSHKPAASSMTVSPIPTAPESVWDHIEYVEASMPTYQFGSSLTHVPTADAFVTLNTSMVTGANFFATSLRGTHSLLSYMDGVNLFFSGPGGGASEGSETGHLYAHAAAQRPPYSSWDTPQGAIALGDASTPPWTYQRDYGGTGLVEVSYSPSVAATARILLVRRISNVTYRTDATLFVASGRGSVAPAWMSLKGVYVPKAGHYRAHFGFMKENVDIDFAEGGNYIALPLAMFQPTSPVSSGAALGRLGIFANYLVGPPKVITYYASTEAEAASGLGNMNLDEWVDYYIDFEVSAACLVEMRHGSGPSNEVSPAIFDILDIYATD